MIKHYVINLKRRPEKLDMWMKHQNEMDMDMSNTEIFYAVDKNDFSNLGEVASYAVERSPDLEFWQLAADREDPVYGLECLRLSHDILLTKIASEPEGIHVIWLDDIGLKINYPRFCKYVGYYFNIYDNFYDNYYKTEFLFDCNVDTYHDTHLLHRIVANELMIMTPDGAQKAFEAGKNHFTEEEGPFSYSSTVILPSLINERWIASVSGLSQPTPAQLAISDMEH